MRLAIEEFGHSIYLGFLPNRLALNITPVNNCDR